MNQFSRESPVNCVNFKQVLTIAAYVPTDGIPFLPFFALRPAVLNPWFPVCARFSSFLSVHSMRPAGKHVLHRSAFFSFVFLWLSKPCPPPTGQNQKLRTRRNSGGCGAYLFRLCSNAESSYSGSLIGVNLARSSFSPPVGSTGSRL